LGLDTEVFLSAAAISAGHLAGVRDVGEARVQRRRSS